MGGLWPAQEPRRAPRAMIATVNPLASAAGLQVLARGGNAVDAAVAAAAVLTVVEPWSGQLGGDAFLLVASAGGAGVTAINGSGAAPRAATLDRFRAVGEIPESGWLAATVPGVVDAWQVALDRFGSRPLGELLQDAIHYAEHGFPLTEKQAGSNEHMAEAAAPFSETVSIFYRNQKPPAAGVVLRQPELATTLRTIAAKGAGTFYRGPLAAAIVGASQRAGGLFALEDFAEHRTEVLDPIETSYRGWRIVEQPPVSQGLILLAALNILETFDAHRSTVERVHLQVEAHKLALAERLALAGDPQFVTPAIQGLLSKERARTLAGSIDMSRAGQPRLSAAGRPDTTYLCVVDQERNVVSYIHSLYSGNGVVAGGTGVLLNNRMRCFTLDETNPNCLAPGKRPMHTLNSWILMRDGRARVVGGTPGAFWQVQTNLQVISGLLDGGLPLQEAIDAPRWTMGPQDDWTQSWLSLEGRFGEAVEAGLRARGHDVKLIGDWAAGGAAQAIEISDESLIGAGDPRPGTSSVVGF